MMDRRTFIGSVAGGLFLMQGLRTVDD